MNIRAARLRSKRASLRPYLQLAEIWLTTAKHITLAFLIIMSTKFIEKGASMKRLILVIGLLTVFLTGCVVHDRHSGYRDGYRYSGPTHERVYHHKKIQHHKRLQHHKRVQHHKKLQRHKKYSRPAKHKSHRANHHRHRR